MGVDKALKKKVNMDWQNAFPQLTMYSQNKFYKVVGSCILGIELIKSPHAENYSPVFVMYPLWKKDVKACLEYPILVRDFKNKKGFHYDIPYSKHEVLLEDVLDSVRKQTPLPLEGDISLNKAVVAIDNSSKMPPLSAAPNSYLQAALQEAKLRMALFVSKGEAEKLIQQVNLRSWDINHFRACGIDVDRWLQSLQEAISHREDFMRQIEVNARNKEVSDLKKSELTA